MGTLYLVATPIGNLEDITLRALRILAEVRLIAAEDTRWTGKLLSHYQIRTSVTSYFEHNKLTKIDHVLQELEIGDVALVSDAGTPGLNDPGYELVKAALEHGFQVSTIPGPCAPVAALVVSGLPVDAFLYLGYLPRKRNDRRQLLDAVADQPYTLVLLESPHRLLASLVDMQDVFSSREICIARELTKLHEEIWRGSLQEALDYFTNNSPRGEFTLVVAGNNTAKSRWPANQLHSAVKDHLDSGNSAAQVAGQLAQASGWPRREIYNLILQLQGGASDGSSHEPG